MSDRKNMKLFALNSNQEIAQKIAQAVGVPLGKLSSRQFSDGEIQVNIEESVPWLWMCTSIQIKQVSLLTTT